MAHPFTFPNPVDEVSARLVAAGAVLLSVTAIVLELDWLVPVIAYGFVARLAAGPRFSPLGLLVTRLVRPRLTIAARPVPGPPKRFAQGIGAVFSLTATVLLFTGAPVAGRLVLGALVLAATLEAALGFCLGCKAFALLMRLGVIPEEVCEACKDIRLRPTTG